MHNAYRDGKVHVLSEKCKTCIFRPGNLMHLSQGRRDDMVQEAKKNESAIICHDTLDTDSNAVCRGFYDVHGMDVFSLRMAKYIDIIQWQEPNNKKRS